jgi:uncharacterized protein (DUF3084 family)
MRKGGAEMEFGWVMLLVLAIMGGIIAYLGDKIGSRVGKKKIKLFGLRPKYSSILITIITGISISAVTLGVMSILSQNVRIALFGMYQLQLQKAELEQQRDRLLEQARNLGIEMEEKNSLLAENEALLRHQEDQLSEANDRIRMTQLDLEQTQAARDDMSRQLTIVQVARDEMMARNEQLNTENDELEKMQAHMTETIGKLDERIKLLNDKMTDIREGQVLFRVGEVLSSTVIMSGQSDTATQEALGELLTKTNDSIRNHLGIQDGSAVLLYVSKDELEETIASLHSMPKGSKLIRITAAGNIILGEPALVHVQIYDNNLIYHKGEVVAELTLRASDVDGSAEYEVFRFLHEVNQQAVKQGLLPDPLTGNVGSLTATQIFDTMQRIKAYNSGEIILRAVTRNDIYTAGPLDIDIMVRGYGAE